MLLPKGQQLRAKRTRLNAGVGLETSMNDWPSRIEPHLYDLGNFLTASDWYGRENELVNLFAHSFLTRKRGNDSLHPSQIGIEVAVQQLHRSGAKALVRKDLVIWGKPNQTVWDGGLPVNTPVAVIEFKTKHIRKCASDISWLMEYTTNFPNVLGYSVCGFIAGQRGIAFRRIQNGKVGYVVRIPAELPNNALQSTCEDARA